MKDKMFLECQCRKVCLSLDSSASKDSGHVVCGCKGCRSFAYFLGQQDRLLDESGGTRILQLDPGKVRIVEGQENIACVRQTPKGALRWYASCCMSPLGNTFPTSKVPFLGVFADQIKTEDGNVVASENLGPVRVRVNCPDHRENATGAAVLPYFCRMTFLLGKWKLTSKSSSPFFNPDTLRPITKVRKLNQNEYEALLA